MKDVNEQNEQNIPLKDVDEVRQFSGSFVNATYRSLEDKELKINDLFNYLRPLGLGDDMIKDIGLSWGQLAETTIPQLEESDSKFSNETTSLPEFDRFAVNKFESGLVALMALIAKSTRKEFVEEGIKEGIAIGAHRKLKELQEAGEITKETMVAFS